MLPTVSLSSMSAALPANRSDQAEPNPATRAPDEDESSADEQEAAREQHSDGDEQEDVDSAEGSGIQVSPEEMNVSQRMPFVVSKQVRTCWNFVCSKR